MFIHDTIKIEYIKQGYLPDYPYHLISDEEMFNAFIIDELNVNESIGRKVKVGKTCLWDDPKSYIVSYKLASFEFTYDEGEPVLIIRGRRDNLVQFNQLLGLKCQCMLSDNCYFSANYPCLYDSLEDAYNKLVDCIYYHISAYLNSCDTSSVQYVPDWVYSYMNGSVISVNSLQSDIHDMLVLMNMDNPNDEFTKDIMLSCMTISKKWIDKLPPSKNVNRPPTMFGEPHVIKSLRITGLLSDDEPI